MVVYARLDYRPRLGSKCSLGISNFLILLKDDDPKVYTFSKVHSLLSYIHLLSNEYKLKYLPKEKCIQSLQSC